MKPRFTWFLLCILSLIITGCIPFNLQRTSPSPSMVVTKPAITITPTQPKLLATPSPTVQEPSPLPLLSQTMTSSPTSMPTPVVGVQLSTIPLGEKLLLEVNGNKKIAIKIEEILQDSEASTILNDQKPPPGLKWIAVKLSMEYLEGPAQDRLQLLHEYIFDIISNGHVLSDSKINVREPPTPRVGSIDVQVGETGFGWLTYYAYQDDFHPVLRMELLDSTYYFALADVGEEGTQPTDTSSIPPNIISFGESGTGTFDNPVPLGTSVSYLSNKSGIQIHLTVERSYRGFQAMQDVTALWGVNTPIPSGMDYIMAYVSIQVTGSPDEMVRLSPTSFSVISKGKTIASPFSFACFSPCFGPMTLYLGGKGSGWLPLLVHIDDPNPVLVFDENVNLTLMSDIDQSVISQSLFSPIAIGMGNIQNVKVDKKMRQSSVVQALSFSPNSSLLASAGDDRKIYIWKTEDGSIVTELDEHKASIKDLDFSPDGSLLASISHDDEVIIWFTSNWRVKQKLTQEGRGIFARFLPGGSLVTATQEGKITRWDIESGEIIETQNTPRMMNPKCRMSPLHSFDISQDGKFFASALACGYAVMWSTDSDTPLAVDSNNAADINQWPTTSSVTFMQRGGLVAYGSSYYQTVGQFVDLVDLTTGYVTTSLGSTSLNIPALAFSPNGTVLAATVGRVIRVWWQKDNKWTSNIVLDLKSHGVQVTSIEFSQDAIFFASGDYQGNIVIWRVLG